MAPKLSIIIPVFNAEDYLNKCLNSILNQTFDDFEVICVNDGSTDNSLEILTEYAKQDKRIKIIDQKNSGTATARKTGLDNSSGEFITFIDNDDWIEPDTYKLTLAKMTDDVDIVCFGANVPVDESLELSEQNLKIINSTKEYLTPKFKGEFPVDIRIFLSLTVFIWDKIFKNSIIKENKIDFLTTLTCSCDDANFLYKYLFVNNNIYFFNQCFYNYLQRSSSGMYSRVRKKTIEQLNDGCLSLYDVYEFLKSKNIHKKHAVLFLQLIYRHLYYDYSFCSEENYNKLFDFAFNVVSKMELGPVENDLLIKEIKKRNTPGCIAALKKVCKYELC